MSPDSHDGVGLLPASATSGVVAKHRTPNRDTLAQKERGGRGQTPGGGMTGRGQSLGRVARGWHSKGAQSPGTSGSPLLSYSKPSLCKFFLLFHFFVP